MTLRDKLKQCELIFKYVYQNPKKTQAEIIQYIEDNSEEFMATESAYIEPDKPFRRVLERIKAEYGIYIKAGGDEDNPCAMNKYVIIKSDLDMDDLMELYEIAHSIGIPTGNLNKLKKMKNFIHFSNSKDTGRPKHIATLLDLCIKSHEVVFDYKKYGAEEATIRKVQPYQMREYKGRWYLIGIEPDLADIEPHPEIVKFRAYGLDRMQNLENGKKFKRDKDTVQAYKDHYADVIGIVNGYNYQEGTKIDAEKVHLRVDKYFWNFIDTAPWHHSQKRIKVNNNHVEFELFVKPTLELVELIFQWSPKVEVLEPTSLRTNVMGQLEKSLSLYK